MFIANTRATITIVLLPLTTSHHNSHIPFNAHIQNIKINNVLHLFKACQESIKHIQVTLAENLRKFKDRNLICYTIH